MAFFFYGTLLAPQVLSRVLGHEVAKRQWATLKNYARHRVRGLDYPALIPEENAEVRGMVYDGLSVEDMHRLDLFEGEEYARHDIHLLLEDGSEVAAQTYVWVDSHDRLDHVPWNFDDFLREKLGRWTGEASTEYEAVEGDTTGGRNLGTFWDRNTL